MCANPQNDTGLQGPMWPLLHKKTVDDPTVNHRHAFIFKHDFA